MPENFIMQVRRPKGVLGEREAFVSRAAQASAAACTNKFTYDEFKTAKFGFSIFDMF